MADSADRPDEDDPLAIELPSGPRRPGKLLLALITIAGVVLIAAPFTFATLGTRHLAPTHAVMRVGGAGASPDSGRSSNDSTSALLFSGIAGPGCTATSTSSYHRAGDFYNGHEGWMHFGTGCTERADSMPLSGDANRPDPTLYAEWDFGTGPVQRGSCDVQVYVSSRNDIVYNGGDPAHYVAYDAIDGGGSIARFTIAQPSHLGSWVPAGHLPIDHGQLRIVATNEGLNAVDGVKTYRHISAGAIKVLCS